jgi:hypothetical protein
VRLSACVFGCSKQPAGFGVNGAQFETTIHDTVLRSALSSLGCACKGAQPKTDVFTSHALCVRFLRPPALCTRFIDACTRLHGTPTLP